MDSLIIQGGTPLKGTLKVSGSQNSALPIMAACLMGNSFSTLYDVPDLPEIRLMRILLEGLGCNISRFSNGDLRIEVVDPSKCAASYDRVKNLRSSQCILGPLLARCRQVKMWCPVNTGMGKYPIDLHLRALEKLGAKFEQEGEYLIGKVAGRLQGCKMYLGGAQGPTVLGTISLMCAATLAEGATEIVGAAREPEVEDCANFLNQMGARISGHGTDTITIIGVDQLQGVKHRIIPDRIEAGTLMMAAAITKERSQLNLRNCNLEHMLTVVNHLQQMGVEITQLGNLVTVERSGQLKSVDVTTGPYPRFPTDLQAQVVALLCLADDTSVVTERVFPDRFLHVAGLNRMGARITKEGSTVIVRGVQELWGTPLMASDRRGSAALVLAAMAANGETRIGRVYHLDRGYDQLDKKLTLVGAQIKRIQN